MFDLSKSYCDCVSPPGDALIAYSARLRWGASSLDYESVLEKRGDAVEQRSGAGPAFEWRSPTAELNERIFESADGFIDWRCIHPRALAVSDAISGLGYREHLHMTVAPWRLPIRELRWGRYLSERHAVVWIDWRGDFSTTVVYRDGQRVAAERVGDDEIVLAGGIRIRFEESFVLREGALGTTVFATIPVLNRTAPARMLAVDECKWRSRGVYSSVGEPEESSWVIHEVVRWP